MTNPNDTSAISSYDIGEAAHGIAQHCTVARAVRAKRVPKSLTTKGLEAAKPGPPMFDAMTPGLHIRVTTARKTWGFMFTPPGEARTVRTRLTLGTFPATTLEEARKAAVDARGKLERGIDPRAIAPIPPACMTVSQMVDDRIRLEVRPDTINFLRTCMEIERMYDVDVIPVVGDVPIKDFRISHLNKVIDPILARGAPTQANRVFDVVRALLKFAVRRGEIEFDPLSAARPPSEENVCQRFLSLEEIPVFWSKVETALPAPQIVVFENGVLCSRPRPTKTVSTILKLCLVLLRRINEVVGMRRSEIDDAKRLWTIPKERMKGRNKKATAFVVPLSDLAWQLISEAMRATNGEYLFPDADGEPFAVSDICHDLLDAQPAFGLETSFTSHDLRRTGSSQMSLEDNVIDVPEAYIGYVLNHRTVTNKTVTQKHYIVNQRLREKREALDKWGAFLSKLVATPQAVQMAAE